MKIVTPSQMKGMDRRAVEEGLFSSLRLMQNAAESLYREITPWIEEQSADKVLLLAGPGNNGGDAYALACLLYPDYNPAVMPLGEGERSPDCEYYYQKCLELGIPFETEPSGYPLVVDGVFGTGFHGELPDSVRAVFEKIKAPVAAIDLPSGMNGENGLCAKGTLKPFLTVTFAFQKPCHLLADCGKVVLADIGIPERYADDIDVCILTPVLPTRREWGHKNSYGAVGLCVGAPQYPGAAALALKGALQSGAGLVYADVPSEIRSVLAAKFYGPVFQKAECDAWLVGSGLGREKEAREKVKSLWESEKPLVVDGDGLWHLKEFLKTRKGITVLTPHVGEFARLLGVEKQELLQDRLAYAEDFARKNQLVLVLKDAATLVTDGKRTEILSAPCSALAKGGSGDLLAGLLAGMLAGEGDPFDLAKTAVYLHNRAARLASQEHSVRALQPEMIANYIDKAWMELEHGAF